MKKEIDQTGQSDLKLTNCKHEEKMFTGYFHIYNNLVFCASLFYVFKTTEESGLKLNELRKQSIENLVCLEKKKKSALVNSKELSLFRGLHFLKLGSYFIQE